MGNREQGTGNRKDKHLNRPSTIQPSSLASPIPDPRSLVTVTGTLYIIATPIGNLEDITFRAVRVLKEADLIAAEDTRHSRKLLSHFGISRPLTSYFDHNKDFKGKYILEKLMEGVTVALISDAGTPCISDPGYQLVRDAVAAGVAVVPIPGPCAAIAALSASGLPTDLFTFEGFLPNRRGKRRDRLEALRDEQGVLIFYESPNRLLATLADMAEILGEREAVVARELTKIYEEFVRGQLTHVAEQFIGGKVRGEVVILVAPAVGEGDTNGPSVSVLLQKLFASGEISLKDAVKQVALETGAARGEVYDQALRVKQEIRPKAEG